MKKDSTTPKLQKPDQNWVSRPLKSWTEATLAALGTQVTWQGLSNKMFDWFESLLDLPFPSFHVDPAKANRNGQLHCDSRGEKVWPRLFLDIISN